MAWASFVGFIAAAVWSLLYLLRGAQPRHDRAAAVAIELGLLFGVLATVTGAIWARIEWGACWNWDPRQTSILISLLFYAAYLALRGAVEDPETRARLAAAYAAARAGGDAVPLLGDAAACTFSLHPEPVVNADGQGRDGPADAAGAAAPARLGFTALFFWMHNLQLPAPGARWRGERH